MRDVRRRSVEDDDPIVVEFRVRMKKLQEACAPLMALAKGAQPPKLQVSLGLTCFDLA